MENVNLPHRCIVNGVDRGAHDFETLPVLSAHDEPQTNLTKCKNCGIHLGQALFELGKLVEEKIK